MISAAGRPAAGSPVHSRHSDAANAVSLCFFMMITLSFSSARSADSIESVLRQDALLFPNSAAPAQDPHLIYLQYTKIISQMQLFCEKTSDLALKIYHKFVNGQTLFII